ncbi:MAG: SLBB domain-containing protein [Alphaproteobacteria bacterium]
MGRTPSTIPWLGLAVSGFLGLAAGCGMTSAKAQDAGIADAARLRAETALDAATDDPSDRPVFGRNLFTGSFAASRVSQQENYKLQQGDKVLLRLFGGQSEEGVETIDAKGNLFVPGVGPLALEGVAASDLQPRIEKGVGKVYKDTVQVYAALLSPGSIGVYVSGHVPRPGRYLGSPQDDLLFYLDQAGGIDVARGSFRAVDLRRGGRLLKTVDLYDFLILGEVPRQRLKDGDVIFVRPRGPVVAVDGEARAPFAFELSGAEATGAALTALAQIRASVSNVSLRGVRRGAPFTRYYSLAEFSRADLLAGDHVTFRTDSLGRSIAVAVEARLTTPSVQILPRDARLSELLALISVDGSSVDPKSVYVRRPSVAAQQKQALLDSLSRLERDVLAGSALNQEQAQLQMTEANLIARFVEQAKEVDPEGVISVFEDGTLSDIRLEDGDTIVIPDRTDVIIVAGEVVAPGAFAARDGLTARDYIDRAGGYSRSAQRNDLVIRRQNGTSLRAGPGFKPQPGDQILVLPKVNGRLFALTKDITQILFQIALSTATVLRI